MSLREELLFKLIACADNEYGGKGMRSYGSKKVTGLSFQHYAGITQDTYVLQQLSPVTARIAFTLTRVVSR